MLKRYNVTVNGVQYQVEVEEVNGEFTGVPVVQNQTPQVVAQAPTIAQVPVAPQPVEVKEEVKKPVVAANGEKIECPMPGTILSVNVSEGQVLKEGDVMCVLEAMKMENEIMAPRDCKIVQIGVAKGAAVNTGDLLVVIE